MALVALTATVGGCGGARGSRSVSGLSRTDLAAQANAICAAAIAQHLPTGGFVLDAATFAARLDQALPILDRQSEALRRLTPNAAAAQDWRAFVSAEAAVDRLAHRERAALDRPGGRSADAGNLAVARRLTANATRVGATTCVGG
jgi:hypothetical protein